MMSCNWEGNCRSGVALAMRHRLKRFVHLRAQDLSKGDEHPTNTLHGVLYSLPLPRACGIIKVRGEVCCVRLPCYILDIVYIITQSQACFWATVCYRSPYAIGPFSVLSCLSSLWCWCIVAKRFDGSRWNLACRYCVRWDPEPLPQWGTANFRPISVVAKWLDGWRCHLVGR